MIKDWEIRDRTYILTGKSPLTYKIKSKGIIWFDEDSGLNREIRYASNQNTLFRDEQDKYAKLELVIFQDGVLNVCLLYTSPSPRDRTRSRMPSSA